MITQLNIIITTTFSFLLLAGPGIVLSFIIFPKNSTAVNFSIGSTMGIALTVYFAYLCAIINVNYFFHLYATGFLLLLCLFKLQLKQNIILPAFNSTNAILFFILALTFLSRAIPLFFSPFPHGADSAFHLILIKKILLTNTLPLDWLPFENRPVFYPPGTHLFVAILSKISSLPAHQTYNACFPVLATLSAALIFLLAEKITGDKSISLLSAFSYSFLANWGSLDYYRWGGLPNMLGMTILLGIIWALLSRGTQFWLAGFLLACLNISHNHSPLTAYLILSAALIYFYFLKKNTGFGSGIWKAILISLCLSSHEIIYYLKQIYLHGTSKLILGYRPQVSLSAAPHEIGLILFVFSALGIFYFSKIRNSISKYFFAVWLSMLAAAFFGTDYFFRFIFLKITGKNTCFLESTRFLTDIAYPLAILSGIGLSRLYAFIKNRIYFFLFLISLLIYPAAVISGQSYSQLSGTEYNIFCWIRNNTPQNAVIAPLFIPKTWQYYVTWREGIDLNLNVITDTTETIEKKKIILSMDYQNIYPWAKRHQKPVYYIGKENVLKQEWLKKKYAENGLAVYEVIAQK